MSLERLEKITVCKLIMFRYISFSTSKKSGFTCTLNYCCNLGINIIFLLYTVTSKIQFGYSIWIECKLHVSCNNFLLQIKLLISLLKGLLVQEDQRLCESSIKWCG